MKVFCCEFIKFFLALMEPLERLTVSVVAAWFLPGVNLAVETGYLLELELSSGSTRVNSLYFGTVASDAKLVCVVVPIE